MYSPRAEYQEGVPVLPGTKTLPMVNLRGVWAGGGSSSPSRTTDAVACRDLGILHCGGVAHLVLFRSMVRWTLLCVRVCVVAQEGCTAGQLIKLFVDYRDRASDRPVGCFRAFSPLLLSSLPPCAST